MSEAVVLSTIGKVPINADETVWVTVQVIFSVERGGHRVHVFADHAGPIIMGSDAAAALAALLRVADDKCREAAEYARLHARNQN